MSTLGHPGDFSMMLAENEEANPWTPIHMDLGYPRSANVVTVLAAEGTHSVYGIGRSSQGFLKMIAEYLAGMDRAYRSSLLLVLAQDTARDAGERWVDKEKISAFIRENARLPFPEL